MLFFLEFLYLIKHAYYFAHTQHQSQTSTTNDSDLTYDL